MTQLALDDADVLTRLELEGRIGVAQVVGATLAQPSTPAGGSEPPFKIESLIERRQLLPRSLALAARRLRLNGDDAVLDLTDEEITQFIDDRKAADADQLRRNFSNEGAGRVDLGGDGSPRPSNPSGERPDEEIVRRANELIDEAANKGRKLIFQEAARTVIKKNPDLHRRYIFMPDELWGAK